MTERHLSTRNIARFPPPSCAANIVDKEIGVWFPKVRTGTGTDVFTKRLVKALNQRGIRAEVTWLPSYAEYLPWAAKRLDPPEWSNIVHITSSLHHRFVSTSLPVVATVHHGVHDPLLTIYLHASQRLYRRFWIRRCEAVSLRRATTVTAVSLYATERVKKVFGRLDVKTIHNWIDLETFCPDQRRQPHNPFRLLFVGKLSSIKGADLLPKILDILRGNFELRYTGTSEELTGSPYLPDNIRALGKISGDRELADIYRQCDALLFPSRIEGFGLAALEAQACGRPVICTNSSSLPEVVSDGFSGFLCPMDDIDAFAAAALKLQKNPAIWREMSLNARSQAETKFGEEASIEDYILLYKTVSAARTVL